MTEQDYIEIVKNKTLLFSTRVEALHQIIRCPAPGALKRLLSDDKVINALTFDIHDNGVASKFFSLIYVAFEIYDNRATGDDQCRL